MSITVAMRTEISQLYVSLFGRAPDGEGLGFWVSSYSKGTSLASIAQSMYDTAPARAYYPLFATPSEVVTTFYTNVLGRAPDAEGLAFWVKEYNASATQGAFFSKLISNVVNYNGTDAAGLTSKSLFTNKVAVAQYYGELNGNVAGATTALNGVTAVATTVDTAKAAILNTAVPGQTFTLTTGVDTFIGSASNDAFNGAVTLQFNALDTIDGGAGTDTLNVADAGAAIATAGRTVTNVEIANLSAATTLVASTTGWTGLTTLKTTSTGGATVTASATTDVTVTESGTAATDNLIAINGGKNVVVVASGTTTAAADAATEITVGATTAAVGTVNVTNSFRGADTEVQPDVGVTGGTVITVTESLGNVTGNTTTTHGKVLVTGSALTTTVVVNQDKAATAAAAVTNGNAAVVGRVNGTVTIADANAGNASTDTITSVTLNSYGASTIDSTVLATLNLAGTGGTLGINKSTSDTTGTARTLALNVDGGAVLGAISGTHAADFTTLNVTTTGTTASTISNATFSAVTTLAVSGTSKLTFTDNTFAALTTVTAGDGGLAMGTTALAPTVTFTGGAGDDSIISGATAKTINMGAGANTVTLSDGVTALSTGGSITAGAGTSDTLSFATTANAVTLSTAGSAQTAFKAAVTGFERLKLAAAAGAVTVDVAGVLGATNGSFVTTTAVATNVLTLSNLVTSGTGATVNIEAVNATTTGTGGVTLNGTAGAGISDILNLNLKNTAADGALVAGGVVDAANIETVNITVNDARVAGLAVPAQAVNTLTLTDAQLNVVTISGNQSLSLTHTSGTAMTSFDASGLTLGSIAFTSNANQYATNVKGSLLGGDTLNFSAATAAVTITETAGTNTITGSGTVASTLTGGSGADTIIGGSGADVIVGGAGTDTIYADNIGTKAVAKFTISIAAATTIASNIVGATVVLNIFGTDVTTTFAASDTTATLQAAAIVTAINASTSGVSKLVLASQASGAITLTSIVDGLSFGVDLTGSTATDGAANGVTIKRGGTTLNTAMSLADGLDANSTAQTVNTTATAVQILTGSVVGTLGATASNVITGGTSADTFIFGNRSQAPSSTVFNTINDFTNASDIITYVNGPLSIVTAATAAASGTASITASGIASFHAADSTLALRIVATEAGIQSGTATAGQTAVFQFGSDAYVFISNGTDGVGSGDQLIKLTGVDTTSVSYDVVTVSANSLTIA